jgi:16S rRNA (guanine(527)-N(7))-methyltransferase RsmG
MSVFESKGIIPMKFDAYVDFLLAYNEKVNLVSKKSTRETINVLISESLLLKKHLSTNFVIDAGSGGGLLGIPLALSFPEKRMVLTETVQKKVVFLKLAIEELALKNVMVWGGPIQEYMQRHKKNVGTLISRGFPHIDILADYVFKKTINELILITAPLKINKIQKKMANIEQNSYNIPSRDNLIIFKMENVSRETQ